MTCAICPKRWFCLIACPAANERLVKIEENLERKGKQNG